MRAHADAWLDGDFVQQAVARLPWCHNLALLDVAGDELFADLVFYHFKLQ